MSFAWVVDHVLRPRQHMAPSPSAGVAASDVRLAELMSGIGALVLGIGIGSYLPLWGPSAALTVIVLGAMLHGVAMWDLHHLDAGHRLRWTTFAYRLCWFLLIIGALLLAPSMR